MMSLSRPALPICTMFFFFCHSRIAGFSSRAASGGEHIESVVTPPMRLFSKRQSHAPPKRLRFCPRFVCFAGLSISLCSDWGDARVMRWLSARHRHRPCESYALKGHAFGGKCPEVKRINVLSGLRAVNWYRGLLFAVCREHWWLGKEWESKLHSEERKDSQLTRTRGRWRILGTTNAITQHASGHDSMHPPFHTRFYFYDWAQIYLEAKCVYMYFGRLKRG